LSTIAGKWDKTVFGWGDAAQETGTHSGMYYLLA
jgi:hypothetical protein